MAEEHEPFTRIESPGAEKRDMLIGSGVIEAGLRHGSTQVKARRLLDSWVAGDRRRLEEELERWGEGDFTHTHAEDEGREGLLRCLVEQMMEEPDLFAPRSEKMHLGVWVDLLVHLAHPELAESGVD